MKNLRTITLFFVSAILASVHISFGQTVQTFTTSGNFTVPSGVTSITVECWGAGGGGGRSTSDNTGRGGGGGGAYASSVLTVSPGAVIAYSVGAGGTGGNLTAAQNTGGTTSFGTTLVVAVGGGGVANNSNTAGTGGAAASCTGTITFSGGNGVAGSGGTAGAGGGGAGTANVGGSGSGVTSGAGGANNGGAGGAGRTNAGDGNSGATYGGGGGGGRKGGFLTSNRNGGAGASGAVRITYTLPACSGLPDAGTGVINSSAACPSVAVNLSATGLSAGPGISYQWQSAPTASGPWTDISGATNDTYSTTTSVLTYYRIVTSCSNSGLSNNSSIVSRTVLEACNCAAYTIVSASNSADTDISSVTVGSMTNNLSTCSSAAPGAGSIAGRYSNFTSSVSGPTQMQGTTVSFSVVQNSCSGTQYDNLIQIYVDWNQNGTFEAGERMAQSTIVTNVSPGFSGSFTVPLTATPGSTRMRITCTESAILNTNYAATGYTYGETEDYCFTVLPMPACAGTPNAGTAVSSLSSGCTGTQITLSQNTGEISSNLSYQWFSSPTGGAPWTSIPSATSTSLTLTPTTTLYYQLQVTCGNSGLSSVTNSVLFTSLACGTLNIPYSGNSTNLCGVSNFVYDHAGPSTNFSNDANGYTVFEATGNAVINISGTYSVESGGNYDYVRIYAGAGTGGTLLNSYTNGSGTINYTGNPGQTLTIQFTSDISGAASGLALQVTYSGVCAPAAPSGVSATQPSICPGESSTLTASGVLGDLYWFEGSCATTGQLQIGNNLVVSPTSTTIYYARNYQNGFFSTTCSSITINVNSAPSNLDITGLVLTCASNPVDLTATAIPATQTLTSSATYTLGNGNADFGFQSLPGASSCALPLSVSVPAGATITGVDVVYNIEALNFQSGSIFGIPLYDDAWMSEQRSQLRCVSSGGTSEASLATGVGATLGTMNYSRTGLNIANAVTSSGTVDFELHVGRTFGLTGCNNIVQRVLNNSFTVIVHYTDVAPLTYSWSGPNIISGALTDIASVQPSSSATYTVTATSNGCSMIENYNVDVSSFEGTHVHTGYNSFTWLDGNTYTSSNNTATYTMVGGASNGCDSLITLNLTLTNANVPSNDMPCNAQLITSSGATALNTYSTLGVMTCNNRSGNNTFANTDFIGSPCSGSQGRSMWYKFTTPMCAVGGLVPFEIELSTNNLGTNFDTRIYVYESSNNTCLGTFTQVNCNDDNGGVGYPIICGASGSETSTILQTNLLPNKNYWVKVDGSNMSEFGLFILSARAISNPHTAVSNTPTSVTLTTADKGASLYSYYYKQVGSPGYSLMNSASLTDTRILTNGVSYETQVMYRCTSAASQFYRTPVVTIAVPSIAACTPVSALDCAPDGLGGYTISWPEVSGLYTNGGLLSGYQIYYRVIGSAGYSVLSNPTVTCVGSVCSYTFAGLTNPAGYEFWIKTRCSSTVALQSNIATCAGSKSSIGATHTFVNPTTGAEFYDIALTEDWNNFGLEFSDLGDYYVGINKDNEIYAVKTAEPNMIHAGTDVSFELVPNPTNSATTMTFNNTIKSGTFQVLDAMGREVLSADISNTNAVELDGSNWNSGVYLVQVTLNDRIFTKRLVISK